MRYIWQQKQWPNFTWDNNALDQHAYALEASRLVGEVQHLSKTEKTDALIDLMVSEAVKTSQIEGEHFDREDVRSSIRNQLGLNATPDTVRDPNANGVASLMISVRDHFAAPLTEDSLCAWQDMIMVGDYHRAMQDVGNWRTSTEPMQVVSGPIGREKIHYEAPPSSQIPAEMARFIKWFNNSREMKGALRAGVAHLYFECIHPFADGNGRIGRAICGSALSQELGHPALLSLSTTIEGRKQEYYDALSGASRGSLDITEWLVWFTGMVLDSQRQAKEQVAYVLAKAHFWGTYADRFNERQLHVLKRMLREGHEGFEGGMSAQKYAKITGCSKSTATRDLTELLQMGATRMLAGSGRSTRYDIQFPDE